MISRGLEQRLAASKKSILLLGPRQTGKSTLIASLSPDISINFAHEPTYLEFLRDSSQLEQRLGALRPPATVFIDEVQRLPSILNTVQFLLDRPNNRFKFYLTGSSARKLKRGQANLLPGRIHSYTLGPLSCGELDYSIDTRQALSIGTLPGIWTEENEEARRKTLQSYAATYLKEEVQAESLSRNLEGFARFLHAVAAWAGNFLDLAKIATTACVARQTAVRYFEVLEDCLVVQRVDAFAKSLTKRLVQHPRFFFFDVGILNGLLGNFVASSDRIGRLFEHLICNQIQNEASTRDVQIRISAYRTEHGAEVDFVVEKEGDTFAIEVKASQTVAASDTRGLQNFRDYYGNKHHSWILYLGNIRKQLSGVEIWPWQEGIRNLFGG
jgi:predicted AAA+ superfamily ATPase